MIKKSVIGLLNVNLQDGQKLSAETLADQLDVVSEDKWNVFVDEDDSICIERALCDKDLKFIITKAYHRYDSFIIFLKMDRRQYPPVCRTGFNPSESLILELLSWIAA